jgi:hypothetical protein
MTLAGMKYLKSRVIYAGKDRKERLIISAGAKTGFDSRRRSGDNRAVQ